VTVRIAARVPDTISQHAAATRPLTACGLLIGRREEGSIWIERSLRCSNEASRAAGIGGFAIDPRAIANVTRSLWNTPNGIVGFYYSGGNPLAEPSPRDRALLGTRSDAVLLIEGDAVLSAPRLRAWGDGGAEAEELEIVVVEPSRASLLVCPE
jgi:proteasome lid subunit RPN8/RPN11